MKKYFANMCVNNGTHLIKDLEGTNYRKLAKDISQLARAECFENNEYYWNVWNEEKIIIMTGAGRKTEKGICYINRSYLIGTHI